MRESFQRVGSEWTEKVEYDVSLSSPHFFSYFPPSIPPIFPSFNPASSCVSLTHQALDICKWRYKHFSQ